MFDVSFSELLVIAVVGLLVIGPEKLPKVARTLGALLGRMQRYVAQVKEEINREVRFEELQKLQQEIKQSVENSLVKPVELESSALEASIYAASKPIKTMVENKPNIKAKPATKKRVVAGSKDSKATRSNATKSNTKTNIVASKTSTKIK